MSPKPTVVMETTQKYSESAAVSGCKWMAAYQEMATEALAAG